jgi:hypothetical protein
VFYRTAIIPNIAPYINTWKAISYRSISGMIYFLKN